MEVESNKDKFQDIEDSLDILEHMISTTIELLTEKKIISADEWKDRMYEKVMKDVDNFNPLSC